MLNVVHTTDTDTTLLPLPIVRYYKYPPCILPLPVVLYCRYLPCNTTRNDISIDPILPQLHVVLRRLYLVQGCTNDTVFRTPGLLAGSLNWSCPSLRTPLRISMPFTR